MNVGLCSLYSPFSGYGGLEVHIKELGENLVKQGYKVYYIAYRKRKGENNCFLLRYPLKGPLLFEKKFLYDVAVNPLLLSKFVSDMDLDLVHFEFVRGAFTGLLTKIKCKIPIVIGMQSLPKVFLPAEMKQISNFRIEIGNIVYKFILKRINAVVCPSRYVANIIEKNYQQSCYVIPNSIYVDRYLKLPPKDLAKKELAINEPVILFMGRLDEQKGAEYLVYAMPKILSEVNCKLLIAGEGWMRQRLEYLTLKLGVKEHVRLLGYVSGARKLTCFAAADVFVCPSIFETFGIVNIEALASGLPIVASKVCSIPEIVEDNVNGFLVSPRDSGEIADALIKLLSNEKLRKKMSEKNREKAKEYDWSIAIKQFLNLYDELIKSS